MAQGASEGGATTAVGSCSSDSDEASDELLELVVDQPELGYRVVGYVGHADTYADFGVEHVGGYAEVEAAVNEHGANGVIVAASALGNWALRFALCDMVERGIHVQVSTGLQGLDHRRLRASSVGYEPVMYLEPSMTNSLWERQAKRAMDVVLAGVGMVLALPVLVIAAIRDQARRPRPHLLPAGARRPQRRVVPPPQAAHDGRRRGGSARRAGRHERAHGSAVQVCDRPADHAVGRFLRSSSLDEVPQLINVLKGEMSLVGPRPPLASEYEQFDDELRHRQELMPGITGLWQLEARDNPSFRTYRRLDLFYLRNWSLSLDLMILLLTTYTILTSLVLRTGRDQPDTPPAVSDTGDAVGRSAPATVA